MKISQLYTYPLKSGRGISLEASKVEWRGIQYDRRWVVIDAQQQAITGREYPRLLHIRTQLTPQGILLTSGHLPELMLPFSAQGKPGTTVRIFKETTTGSEVSEEANQWFSRYLETDCRLLYMDEQSYRPVAPRRGGRPGDEVSYADQCPLLLTSYASLSALNAQLPAPASMQQFRPNLLIEGNIPFEEDGWSELQIGECRFRVSQQCKRCVFITIDPETGQKHPEQEPLRTLSTFHRHPAGGAAFGVHLIPLRTGSIRVGDTVTPLH